MGIISDIFKGRTINIPQPGDLRIVELDNGIFEVQQFGGNSDDDMIYLSRVHRMWQSVVDAFETEEGVLVQTVAFSNLKTVEMARKFRELYKKKRQEPKIVRVVE